MPLSIPQLDDRNFEDFMEEILTLIPRYNSSWTNFNPSDPGVTLLELFAWLADQALYRINRIPPETYEKFIQLMGIDFSIYTSEETTAGVRLTKAEVDERLRAGVKQAVAFLEDRYRAVTEEDYGLLTVEKMNEIIPGLGGRAIVVNNIDLERIPRDAQGFGEVTAPGHISVIPIPNRGIDQSALSCDDYVPDDYPQPRVDGLPIPAPALVCLLRKFLDERRLIATRLHVVAPAYQDIEIVALVRAETGRVISTDDIITSIRAFYDPLTGGPAGQGWPPGRSIYVSELYQLLEGSAGVDYVRKVTMKVNGIEYGKEVPLKAWELPAFQPDPVIEVDET